MLVGLLSAPLAYGSHFSIHVVWQDDKKENSVFVHGVFMMWHFVL